MKTCIFRGLGGSEEGGTVPVLGSHSSSPEARKKMIYFGVAPMKTESFRGRRRERDGEIRSLCKSQELPSPTPLQIWLGWVLGSGRSQGLSPARPPGALFGPGSEIDSFWVSGHGQPRAAATAVTSQTFIDSDSQERSLSFVFCIILFVFSL